MKENSNNETQTESEKNIVLRTYEKKAASLENAGYRSAWWYIANKALSDWALFSQAEIDGKRILNIGCSEPIDEIYFARRVKEWIAIDNSPKSIEVARKIINKELSEQLSKKIKLQVANALELPFQDKSFDIVTAFSTIEHIVEPERREKAVQEMARVTKLGGHTVVTVPNRWNLPYYRWSKKMQKSSQTDFGFDHLVHQ